MTFQTNRRYRVEAPGALRCATSRRSRRAPGVGGLLLVALLAFLFMVRPLMQKVTGPAAPAAARRAQAAMSCRRCSGPTVQELQAMEEARLIEGEQAKAGENVRIMALLKRSTDAAKERPMTSPVLRNLMAEPDADMQVQTAMSGIRKAAIVALMLGEEATAESAQAPVREEVAALTTEMAGVGTSARRWASRCSRSSMARAVRRPRHVARRDDGLRIARAAQDVRRRHGPADARPRDARSVPVHGRFTSLRRVPTRKELSKFIPRRTCTQTKNVALHPRAPEPRRVPRKPGRRCCPTR